MNKSRFSTLWARWVIQNELKRLRFWGLTKPFDASWSWRKLLQLRHVFFTKFLYTLGNAASFSFWHDPWLEGQSLVTRFPEINISNADIPKGSKICDVRRNGAWRLPDPMDTVTDVAWEVVRSYSLSADSDCVSWPHSNTSQYTISSAWKILRDPKPKVKWFRIVWGSCFIPRCSFLLWLALQNKLAVKMRLFKLKITGDASCPLCNNCEETVDHLFFQCPVVIPVWDFISSRCMPATKHFRWRRIISWLSRHAGGKSVLASVRRNVVSAAVYHVWNARNRVVFQSVGFDSAQTIRNICFFVRLSVSNGHFDWSSWN